MIDKRYGMIFRQIREQKQLPLSYFEKYGVRKSNLARFERGETMMGFERVDIMLQAMDVSLSDYALFYNYYLPDYQEHFLFEIEQAELNLNYQRIEKLHEEIAFSENKLLILSVKSKIKKLTSEEVEFILSYLRRAQHWSYFELTLNQDIVDYINTEEIQELLEVFEKKIGFYYDVMKYRRKVHQIAYKAIFHLCLKSEEALAKKIFSATRRSDEERLDFYISTLRGVALGCIHYCFENKEIGLLEIYHFLDIFEELGSKKLKSYYFEKIQPIIE